MRTVEEVRRARLELLLTEFRSYAEINRLLDVNPLSSALSQIANQSPNSKGGASKTMGSPMARDLERVCGKPRGWMDTDPDLWPFAEIDLDCVQKLGKPARDKLEGALLLVSIQLGLEVKRIAA